MPALNTAFYHFSPLANLPERKREWLEFLRPLGVKGTLILAPEGVNGFLAGPPEAVMAALRFLRAVPALAGLRSQESESATIPFRKLCLKLKKEIVTFRNPAGPLPSARRISPAELDQWCDANRNFLLLDTRNAYEARIGTFRGACTLPIGQFVEFAEAAKSLPEEWREKPVVTFCTGGIRCEKAAPYLQTLGFREVYQLDGGILNYLAKSEGKHWQGECFVFDERVALDAKLAASGARLCRSCQGPVPRSEPRCGNCGGT